MPLINFLAFIIKKIIINRKMDNVCEFIQNNSNTQLNTYIYIEQDYNECDTFNINLDVFNYVNLKLREYFGNNISNIESIIDNNRLIIKFDINNCSGEIWETIENENENYWVVSLFNKK
jgi:hypothetical protein